MRVRRRDGSSGIIHVSHIGQIHYVAFAGWGAHGPNEKYNYIDRYRNRQPLAKDPSKAILQRRWSKWTTNDILMVNTGSLGTAWRLASQEWITSDHLRSWTFQFHHQLGNNLAAPIGPRWANSTQVFT